MSLGLDIQQISSPTSLTKPIQPNPTQSLYIEKQILSKTNLNLTQLNSKQH